jgi:ribosomal protein S18 acetylase RimI-like enzyme
MHAPFQKTSALSATQVRMIREFLAGRQPFSLYFESALGDLARGLDNRWLWIQEGAGLVIGIEFDGVAIFSSVGSVLPAVLEAMLAHPGKMELHLSEELARDARYLAHPRIESEETLLYFGLERELPFGETNPALRRLTAGDLSAASRFYQAHYPDTIFSSWMLEQPFVGYFEGNELLAAGGTIVLNQGLKAANIGNFLTAHSHRGRGLGSLVVRKLIDELQREGIRAFSLGTTEENQPACQLYARAGFQVLERRKELKLAPA